MIKLLACIFCIFLTQTQAYDTLNNPATQLFIQQLNMLLQEHHISIDDLNRLQSNGELINPISKETADSSSTAFVHYKQLEEIINTKREMFNVPLVQQWAAAKLTELIKQEKVKENVHEETQALRDKMHFISVPAGTYTSTFNDYEFEIPSGIEIQDTLVTQWQWLKIMHYNPSTFIDGPTSEVIDITTLTSLKKNDESELIIHENKNTGDYIHQPDITPKSNRWFREPNAPQVINFNGPRGRTGPRSLLKSSAKIVRLQPNYPVDSTPLTEVKEFIKRLNEQSDDYVYALPSVTLYDAILQNAVGQDWKNRLLSLQNGNKTHGVKEGMYVELTHKKIWDLIGNILQLTNDASLLTHKSNYFAALKDYFSSPSTIAFGVHYGGSIEPLIHTYPSSLDTFAHQEIGFRLMRCRKS